MEGAFQISFSDIHPAMIFLSEKSAVQMYTYRELVFSVKRYIFYIVVFHVSQYFRVECFAVVLL